MTDILFGPPVRHRTRSSISIRAAEPSTNCGIPSKEVPICLLFLRMKRNFYVTNFDAGTVSVIRRSDASAQVLALGGQPIGIDVAPDGSEVWVSNFRSNTITIIDAATDRIA